MKFNKVVDLKYIAEFLGLKFIGNPNHKISGINEIHRVEEGDVVFVDYHKYYEKALTSKATTILIDKVVDCPLGKALLISDDPFRDYNRIIEHFKIQSYSLKNISDTFKIGKNSIIMPGVYIGENVEIGNDCVIHPNVIIYNDCIIGNNVIIHSGSIIGADAFYYKKRAWGYDKMITCGRVIIEDNVEIGALCSIDRGVSSDTTIGFGTKIDNHVQVGHDTIIGKNCIIASQVGISGVVTIEDNVTLWGQVGVPSNLTVGKGSVVLGQSGLMKSVEKNSILFGSPAGDARTKMREIAMLKKLPEVIERLEKIEQIHKK